MIAQGTIVGHRYRIIDLIGTGGMAHVYRAVNLSSRKVVAIKASQHRDADHLGVRAGRRLGIFHHRAAAAGVDGVAQLAEGVDVAAEGSQADAQPGSQLGAAPSVRGLQQRQQLQRPTCRLSHGHAALSSPIE